MKTIGIDCRFASAHAGLGRYAREIVQHLLSLQPDARFVLFVKSPDEAWIKGLSHSPTLVTAPYPHYSLSEQLSFPSVIRKAHIDLFFALHFNVPYLCPVPFVVTVHDLILHHYPNQSSFCKRLVYKMLMKRALSKAKHIIAVSNFTADDVCSVYGEETRKKITVIHEGADERFQRVSEDIQESVCRKYNITSPFFLYVGNAKEHKNVQVLIDAFSQSGMSDHQLLLVTGGKEADQLVVKDGVKIINCVSDDDLPSLYSAATAFVTASLYEGFCLPVIEAAMCGCRVIAANRSVLPEVAGHNALLIEPTVDAFSRAMQGVKNLSSPDHPTFSWQKAAKETLHVLHTV